MEITINWYFLFIFVSSNPEVRNGMNSSHRQGSAQINITDGLRHAYKTFDTEKQENVYIEVETGEELKRLPTVCHAAAPKGLFIRNGKNVALK